MSYGALGLVEVVGSCNAVVVLDQMLKTSDVEFRTWHTKCGGHATVFLNPSSPGICSGIHPPRKMVVATAAMINKFTNSAT